MSDEQDDAVTESSRDNRDSRDTAETRTERQRRATAAKLAAAENKLRVFALRRAGATFRQIARETGLSVGRCHQIVDGELAVLSEQLSHSREQLRALDLERCDALLVKLDGMLREGRRVEKVTDAAGNVTDRIVHATRPPVGYFFAYMRVLERRAKLLGVDAPTKIELSEPKPERAMPDDAIDKKIAELSQAVAAAERRAQQKTGAVH